MLSRWTARTSSQSWYATNNDLLYFVVPPNPNVRATDEFENSAQFITAGYFETEDFGSEKGPIWEAEQRMYTTSAIAPVFVVQRLHAAGLLAAGAKIVLVSSESGSITLRHEKEGGGNYAHHASKTALNMVGKLLSLDLKEAGVVVSMVHPGFMRTEMTASVGFDKYWDEGGGESLLFKNFRRPRYWSLRERAVTGKADFLVLL